MTSTQEKARWNTELGNQKTRMPVSGTPERGRMILKGGIVLSMDPDVGDLKHPRFYANAVNFVGV